MCVGDVTLKLREIGKKLDSVSLFGKKKKKRLKILNIKIVTKLHHKDIELHHFIFGVLLRICVLYTWNET